MTAVVVVEIDRSDRRRIEPRHIGDMNRRIEAAVAEAFRDRVREDVRRGADLIKVCVTGWLADAIGDPRKYEITDGELSAAIAYAYAVEVACSASDAKPRT